MTKTISKIEVYKDRSGEYRWRYIARNGNIMATSSEGYVNRGDAVSAVETLWEDSWEWANDDLRED